jgi:RimJ/RimL family protein N-acetyltransferase
LIELAFDFDEPVADFVARHIPNCERGFGECRAIGIVEDGALIGGVVYNNWSPEAGVIEMHAAATSRRWLTPRTLHTLLAYPFERVGVQMIVLQVSAKNAVMRSIAERVGFEPHLIPRLFGRQEDGILYFLTEERWRDTQFVRSRQRKSH